MKLTEQFGHLIFEAIAYTLCRTQDPSNVGMETFTEWVNNTSRTIFVDFCENQGIDEIEMEEE